MFVGYVDNQLMFATSQPKGKEIISGTLTEEINSVSALEFTLPPSNDTACQITPHASIIRLESDGAEIFRGTANSVSKNFRGDTVVSCDGMIALMADVIRAPGTVSGVNTKSYITSLITNYNAGVADNRHISAGIIDEFGTFTADHSQECKNIFELLKEVLSDKGGYIWASYVGGGCTHQLHQYNRPKKQPADCIWLESCKYRGSARSRDACNARLATWQRRPHNS